jgi:hypothetical protein
VTDEPDDDEEIVGEACVYLGDGQCWVADPAYLDQDSGVQGVLAVKFWGGALYYLDGQTRKWLSCEVSMRAVK